MYIILFPFSIEPVICFNDSLVYITEDQGSAMLTLNLTNPSSSDITARVVTTDGTAIGMCKFHNNYNTVAYIQTFYKINVVIS